MPLEKNLCARTRNRPTAYEVWQSEDGAWTYYVLKKYQIPRLEAKNPNARWYCCTESPGELHGRYGDVYVRDVKAHCMKIKDNTPKVPDVL